MSENLIRDLVKLGLEEKEAKIYLAALELGPSPVQQIAQRAGVPRATTYLVLNDLKSQGLTSTFEKGKKTFFAAESPEQLSAVLSEKITEIHKQEQLVRGLVPALRARGQFRGTSRPVVKFYEGAKALRSLILDNIVRAGEKGGEVLGLSSYDDAGDLLRKSGLTWNDIKVYRTRSRMRRRLIYTWRKKKPTGLDKPLTGAVYVPHRKLPLTADVTIVGNRVSLASYREPVRAVAIEDKAFADGFRAIFNLLWSRLTKSRS